MAQSTDSQQTSIETAAGGEHKDAVIELDDKNKTTLREGDVLADTRTDEKLVVLGYDEECGSIKYYSNYEQEEGLHDPTFIPSCFDVVFRTSGGESEMLPLEQA